MYIVSYLDSDGTRYDASSHTQKEDAEKQLERFALNEMKIEEKEEFNPNPWNLNQ